MSAVECPKCGALRVRAGAQFCDQCGSRIPPSLSKLISESEELRMKLGKREPSQARVDALESTLRARSQELETLRNRASRLESWKLRTSNWKLRISNWKLEAENKGLKAKTVRQSADYKALRERTKETGSLQSQTAALEAENHELKAPKTKADGENVEREDPRAKVKEPESLQGKVLALEDQNRELQSRAAVSSAEYENLRTRTKELESLQVRVVALEAEKRELKAQVERHTRDASINPVVPGVVAKTEPSGVLSDRRQILGASMIALGLLTMLGSMVVVSMNLSGLGLASFLIGLLVVYLRSDPAVPQELMEASVLSSLLNLERILRQVKPEGKAVYLAVHDRSDVPKVLLPLADNPAHSLVLASADEDRYLLTDSEDPHKCGLLLEAPGASLLALMEKESGVDFFDLGTEDFLDALRSGMVESLEVAADVKGTITDNPAKFRIKDGALEGMVRSIARSAPNVSSRLGCPICSVAICAAVKSTKRDIILEEAAHESGYHSLSLRLAGGSSDETR